MGISENVGHDVTFSILNTTTTKLITRSNARPADESTSSNLIIDPLTALDVDKSNHIPSNCVQDNEEAPASREK